MCDDDESVIKQANFKRAALALRLLGGGKSVLPDGYLQAYFLESTGTQYVRMPQLEVNNNDTIKSEFALIEYKNAAANGIFAIVGYDSGQKLRMYALERTNANGRAISYQFGDAAVSIYIPERKVIKWDITKYGCVVNGVQYDKLNTLGFSYSDILLFTQYVNAQYWPSLLRFYKFSVSQKCKLQPALDSTGTPCMYDLVSKQPFRNKGSGSFIVGFTRAQARKLGKLAPGSSFTISLPVGWQEDAGVAAAKAQAEANGCVLPVQEYTEGESVAATYALRRIWVKRTPDALGGYVDADGTRWRVEWCVDVIGAAPESLRYERFRSVDAAVDYWGLVPYVDTEEELLTEA